MQQTQQTQFHNPSPPPAFGSSQVFTGEIEPLTGDVLSFNISRTGKAQVRFNGRITQEAIDKLIAHLDLSKDTYPTEDELKQQPRQAMWKNKDHDQPVTVIGDAGEIDHPSFRGQENNES